MPEEPGDEAIETPADAVITDPGWWLARPEALQEALRIAAEETPERPFELAPPEAYERYEGIVAEAQGQPREDLDEAALATGEPRRLTITVDEAAELLGISRALAYEAVRRGEIPSLRIGRRILVPRSAFGRLFAMDRWARAQPVGDPDDHRSAGSP